MTSQGYAPARSLRAIARAKRRRLLRAMRYWYRYEPFLAPAPEPHPCPICGDIVADDDHGCAVTPPIPGLCFECCLERTGFSGRRGPV